ncbi:hypothetical protein ACNKHS_22815 [Shigella flexneri]
MLDTRAQLEIDQVREAHNELLDAMMQSYRNPDPLCASRSQRFGQPTGYRALTRGRTPPFVSAAGQGIL